MSEIKFLDEKIILKKRSLILYFIISVDTAFGNEHWIIAAK